MPDEDETTSQRSVAHRGPDTRFRKARLGTQCVRATEHWTVPDYWEPVTPIHNANVYFYERAQDLDDMVQHVKPGYGYARWGTPTTAALERLLSTLEESEVTLVGASGMAAVHAALLAAGVKQGATLLCSYNLYGPSFVMAKHIFSSLGARVIFWDFTDLEGLEHLIQTEKPHVVLFEVVTNPLVKVIDGPAVIQMAKHAGAKVLVDNTYLTPLLFKPLDYGADYVIHSVSKYLSGHGDVMAGSVSTWQENYEDLRFIFATIGGILSSNSAWLAIRGIKTFNLRMERHCTNALEIAKFLEKQPNVTNVLYPGLPSHPGHSIAKRILLKELYGGMLSFELIPGGKEQVYKFIDSLKIVVPGGSLGEVHSLILNPSRTTHHNLNEEELAAVGIKPGTLRLSVGLEDVEDIMEDLDLALRLL